MCGRFQILMLIMAINFIPLLRYLRANCHKKRTVGLPLKSRTSSDMNVCQGQFYNNSCQIWALSLGLNYKPINHMDKLSSFKDTIVDNHSNIFHKDSTVKPWKANGLAILL